jgi:hypothetical protein
VVLEGREGRYRSKEMSKSIFDTHNGILNFFWFKLGMVIHTCKSQHSESEVQAQPELHSKTLSLKNKGWGCSSVVVFA